VEGGSRDRGDGFIQVGARLERDRLDRRWQALPVHEIFADDVVPVVLAALMPDVVNAFAVSDAGAIAARVLARPV
jgi:hypothetical protein